MTIKIPHSEEQALVVAIAEGIPTIRVDHGRYIYNNNFEWLDVAQKSLGEETLKKINKYIGTNGVKDFVRGEIRNILVETRDYDYSDARVPLSEVPEFSNTISAARGIVAKLKGVPYRYRVTVALPDIFSNYFIDSVSEAILLSEDISICRGDDLPKPFPVESESKLINERLFVDIFGETEYDKIIKSEKLYFTANILSYGGGSNSAQMAQELADHLRAFYGAARALGIISSSFGSKPEPAPMIMIHEEVKGRPIIATEEMESDLLSKPALSTDKFFKTKERRDPAFLKELFGRISKIYSEDGHARRLYTACIWYYRSLLSERPLDKLLESTVAIEVMLGERDAAEGIGLTKLLGNRCAYLLGKSHSHRNRVMDDFNSVYKLRSSIVRAGKHKIEPQDRPTVAIAERLCGQIIAQELKLMVQSAN